MVLNGVFHNAKIGDVIYSLPAVYLRGGTKRFVLKRKEVFDYLKPLLDVQPYIGDTMQSNKPDDNIDLNFESEQALYKLFLRGNIIYMHLLCAGIRTHHFPLVIDEVSWKSDKSDLYTASVDLRKYKDVGQWRSEHPWLTNIQPNHQFPIIIGVSERYHDYALHNVNKHDPVRYFDYSVLKDYHDGCAFIGFKEEYESFCDRYGFHPAHIEPKSALETAELIAGAKLFVGNLTSTKAIAEGLKTPRLVEICQEYPDAIPMGHTGHIHITKELVDYYLKNDIKEPKFPEKEPPKVDNDKSSVVTIDDFF